MVEYGRLASTVLQSAKCEGRDQTSSDISSKEELDLLQPT
jgi:hypothetical protein